MGKTTDSHLRAVISNFNGVTEALVNTFDLMPIKSIADRKVIEKGGGPDALIIWNDVLTDWRSMCEIANQNHVMTFMVQHGRGGMRDYLNNLHGHVANVAFVWTEEDKKIAIAGKWGEDSVFVVGAPWFHYRPEKKTEKGLVVFDAVHWDKEVEENYKAWDKLNHIPNITPIAKLIESHDPDKFPGAVLQTDRGMFGHIKDTYELLSKAEVVVCMMEGTMELMAYSLGIPVVFLNEFKHTKIRFPTYQGEEDCKPSPACIEANFDNLEEKIKEAIANPPKEKMREELLKWAGDPDTDRPTAKITEIINMLVRDFKEKNYYLFEQ